MSVEDAQEPGDTPRVDMPKYRELLRDFDAAVCEALAVGQASSGRFEAAYVGYTTLIFARLCAFSQCFVRAAPRSRWTKSDAENWDFCAVAGYARAIVEGALLFTYISRNPTTPDEWSCRLLVMHLNDCTRRVRLFETTGDTKQHADFLTEAEDLRRRLKQNSWFGTLSDRRQKDLLAGQTLTISSKDQQIEAAGMDKSEFDTIWQLFSQHVHIQPLSFYRMEPNGRGTGMLNDTDLAYIGLALKKCTEIMSVCTDRMVELFPDVAPVRQGKASKFAPGPRANLPKAMKRSRGRSAL
ncbi:hypothetical protein EJC49_06895 [Aquibium carbonis]|uniref:Uncharacterized protein n=1 Tax=Aquibium carbonis TaxID=2495581 RepID=A0A429Z0B7_9HYPH|nr:hypothetical protein [Aquibium carbonis]RST87165.1 hypothetical protein EJC49_06895 [Aquibium carbonis]